MFSGARALAYQQFGDVVLVSRNSFVMEGLFEAKFAGWFSDSYFIPEVFGKYKSFTFGLDIGLVNVLGLCEGEGFPLLL